MKIRLKIEAFSVQVMTCKMCGWRHVWTGCAGSIEDIAILMQHVDNVHGMRAVIGSAPIESNEEKV